MVLIGILGNKRNGKDTTADFIVKNYNYNKYSFAKPLKDVCKILFNFDDNQLYGDKKEVTDENWNITPRKVMEFIGTDIARNQFNKIIPNINHDFWIKHFEYYYKKNKNINLVVCDVRFQNEVDIIHKYNGIVIKVIRYKKKIKYLHASESNLDKINNFDYLIKNDSSIDLLNNKIKEIMKTINKKYIK